MPPRLACWRNGLRWAPSREWIDPDEPEASSSRQRHRQGHADANFSILRRAALSLLKNERTSKVGIKNKRLTTGWNEDYLKKVLIGE